MTTENKEKSTVTTESELELRKKEVIGGLIYDPSIGVDTLTLAAERHIEAGLVPDNLNTPGALLSVGVYGHALGLDWITAINNIDNIKGRPSLSYRLVSALLVRAGYCVKILRDYETVYDSNNNLVDIVTEMELVHVESLNKAMAKLETIKDYPESVQAYALKIIDDLMSTARRTFKYTWVQANMAGMMSQHNYKVRPQDMFRARCMTGMVRAYAANVLMGFYETTEIHPGAELNDGPEIHYTEAEVIQ